MRFSQSDIASLSVWFASKRTGQTRNVREFGAIGDGVSRPLSTLYATLAEAQMVYPLAWGLTQELDSAAIGKCGAALVAAGGGTRLYPTGTYIININPATKRAITLLPTVAELGEGGDLSIVKMAAAQGNYHAIFASEAFNTGTGVAAVDMSGFSFRLLGVNSNSTENPLSSPDDLKSGTPRYSVFVRRGTTIRVESNHFSDILARNSVIVRSKVYGDARDVWIINNMFSDVGSASEDEQNEDDDAIIVDVDFDASVIYTEAQGVRISGNIMRARAQGAGGARTAIEIHGSDHIVEGNVLENFQVGMNCTGSQYYVTASTRLASAASVATPQTISVLSATGISIGKQIAVVLTSGAIGYGTVTAVAGTTITLNVPLPSAALSNAVVSVYTNYCSTNVKIRNNLITGSVMGIRMYSWIIGAGAAPAIAMLENCDIISNDILLDRQGWQSLQTYLYNWYLDYYAQTNIDNGVNLPTGLPLDATQLANATIYSTAGIRPAGIRIDPAKTAKGAWQALMNNVRILNNNITFLPTTIYGTYDERASGVEGRLTDVSQWHDKWEMRGNVIRNAIGPGIKLAFNTTNSTITDNTIINPGQTTGIDRVAFAVYMSGIVILQGHRSLSINTNTITDDQTTATTLYGIVLGPASSVNCEAIRNRRQITDAAAALLVDPITISGNSAGGFRVEHAVDIHHAFGAKMLAYGSEVRETSTGLLYYQMDTPNGYNWKSGSVPLLADSTLTYDGTNGTFKMLRAGLAQLWISGGTSTARDLIFATAGSIRWLFRTNGTPEAGADAGSNLELQRYSDAGVFVSTVFRWYRATGWLNIGSNGSPTSTLEITGSFSLPLVTKTTTYTITNVDHTIIADATAGGFTLTLPSAGGCTRRIYSIKKSDATANVVTIAGAGGQLIDGASTKTLTAAYQSVRIQSDGTKFHIIGSS